MAKGKITPKQSEILEFLKQEIIKKGYPPAVREICEAVHLKSTSSVHSHLETLEKNGYIRKDPTKPRAIEIMDDSFYSMRSNTTSDVVNIPMIGTVAAGEPLFAVESIEDYFPFAANMLPKTNDDMFILKVKGESMINAGIFDGDYLVVEKKEHAENGEIIVALVDDSATVKRFYKEDDRIVLKPENDFMDPIIVKDCTILGKVIRLIRMNIV